MSTLIVKSIPFTLFAVGQKKTIKIKNFYCLQSTIKLKLEIKSKEDFTKS